MHQRTRAAIATAPAHQDAKLLADEFPGFEVIARLAARYNIAPAQPIVIYKGCRPTAMDIVQWGLVPPWAEDPAIGSGMINARAETAAVKPAFRAAFHRKRCLVPADGWYEWGAIPGRKFRQPVTPGPEPCRNSTTGPVPSS